MAFSNVIWFYIVVDGNWNEWGEWSSCPVTCGDGVVTRVRLCDNPAPHGSGNYCEGSDTSNNTCTVSTPCPGMCLSL